MSSRDVAFSASANRSDAGLATPAAIIVSLAITTVVTATLLFSLGRLHAAKASLRRTQIDYAMEGAQVSAIVTLMGAPSRRLSWRIESPSGSIDMVAEPEAQKVAPSAAEKALSDSVLRTLGVVDVAAARGRLAELAAKPKATVQDLQKLEPTRMWAHCARSILSPWGLADKVQLTRTEAPTFGENTSRSGETWRIVATLSGRSDDRTVILTGDTRRPVIARDRQPVQAGKGLLDCETLFEPAPT